MPCGYWATALGAYWWILPLIGLVFVGLMLFICFRGFGFGCLGRWRRYSGELSQRDVESLREGSGSCCASRTK